MRKKQTLVKPLTLAIHLALGSAAAGLVVPTTVMAQQQTVEFNIPAGNLGNALTQAAAQAGTLLSFDPKLTQGKTTQGLKGNHSLDSGLAQLLASTGLQAYRQADGSYGLQLIPEGSTLPVVSVGGTGFSGPLPLEQEVGYSVRRSNASGFRDKEIIDTPFSVAV
jgi:iron complex outermembrane receptor protein